MSKRAGAVPEETRARLLHAARDEFAEHGFMHSSLRRICSSAGVTTGALYFFFRDKDDMFRAVMDTVTVPFMDIIRKHYEGEDGEGPHGEEADQDATRKSLAFYCGNRKTFGILLSHRDHPAVKDFFREFVEVSVAHYRSLMETMGESPDTDALMMFVRMQLDLMLGIAERDLPENELMKAAGTATLMLRGAYSAIERKEAKGDR